MTQNIDRRQMITRVSASVTAGVSAASLLGSAKSVEAQSPATPTLANSSTKAQVEWPYWDEHETAGLLDVLNSGKWGRTTGPRRVTEFEAAFAEKMKARYCLATASGTTALLTTLGALGIGPGDEVIMPPYTFVATFNSITQNYALPVFVDSDIESFQIDPSKLESAITENTKLLLPVHIGGSPFDIDAVNSIAKRRRIPMIEDACQAPLAAWRGQPVGTHGLAGCFSFQASKNITSGEGGCVLTNDEQFANQCYNFHTPGGSKPAPNTGRGSNFRLTEFQAALLLAQLARLEEHARKRDANAAYLSEMLRAIPGISPAKLTAGCTRSGWHLYMFRYDSKQFSDRPRADFLKELSQKGISASPGYSRLNQSAHVKSLANNPHYLKVYGSQRMNQWLDASSCPANDRLCNEAVWLSQTQLLGSRSDMENIAETVAKIQKANS